jgi:exopolysaccharide biosynthesis polyprenyl glycosylphosphotransferase
MLTSEGRSVATFSGIDKLSHRAKPRLRFSPLVSKPVLDLCAIIFLPALKTCTSAAWQNAAYDLAFWTLAAGFSMLLIYTQGGYGRTPRTKPFEDAGWAVSDFLATSAGMLAASYLSIHSAHALNLWTMAEICLVPLSLLAVRYIDSTTISPFHPLVSTTGQIVICRGTCKTDVNEFLAKAGEFSPKPNILTLENIETSNDQTSEEWAPSTRAIFEKIVRQEVTDVIFINQSSLETVQHAIPPACLQALLIQPVRLWLAMDTTLDFSRAFFADSEKYRLVPLSLTGLVSSDTRSKRFFDIAIASMLLAAFIPILLIIACFVRASGPGPIIFRQRRIGAQGREFTVLKFRTMKYAPGSAFAQARLNDARTTKIGRFLRRSSLDELLQLINVLKGEMSLVGPRPHAPETQVNGICFDAALDHYHLRHRVRPGITGLAQIRGQRGATQDIDTLRRRTESDLEYIANWSLWLDIKIMIKSLAVFVRQDAY